MATASLEGQYLYRFALDCAKHKHLRDCKQACAACPSNISLYITDPKVAVMMQHSAQLDIKARYEAEAAEQERQARVHGSNRLGGLVINIIGLIYSIGILILFLWFMLSCSVADVKPTQSLADMVGTIPVPTTDTGDNPPALFWPAGTDPDIGEALLAVSKRDIDGDGEMNCIDYVLQFYMAYPYKRNIRITWNYGNGMNHLFVMVNGQDIECGAFVQGARRADNGYRLRHFFTNYDPANNKDVTADLNLIMAGMYHWRRTNGN